MFNKIFMSLLKLSIQMFFHGQVKIKMLKDNIQVYSMVRSKLKHPRKKKSPRKKLRHQPKSLHQLQPPKL